MKRFHQYLLIASFLPLCWLGMMGVHELGHVLAGWLTGGTVTEVVLHPLAISRTDVEPNPEPMVVVWAGPLVGVVLPLLMWGSFLIARIRGAYLFRFFAGFCLIANGVYIGIGSVSGIGDARVMQRVGSPAWCLWLFGLLTIPVGLLLWHRLGKYFGFGEAAGRVDRWAAYMSLVVLVLILLVELVLSARV